MACGHTKPEEQINQFMRLKYLVDLSDHSKLRQLYHKTPVNARQLEMWYVEIDIAQNIATYQNGQDWMQGEGLAKCSYSVISMK